MENSIQEQELKPCPFKHDEDDEQSVGIDGVFFNGFCAVCGAEGPDASSKEEGARLWNERKVPA